MLSMTSKLAVFKSHFGICFICGIKQHGKFGSSCSFEIKVRPACYCAINGISRLRCDGLAINLKCHVLFHTCHFTYIVEYIDAQVVHWNFGPANANSVLPLALSPYSMTKLTTPPPAIFFTLHVLRTCLWVIFFLF